MVKELETSSVRIHHLFHGYRRGHERISGSILLSAEDADTVTRLSDLSGTLPSGLNFHSYLTLYPLPSGTFYAVALTKPDSDAPRPGCVLTHTLLFQMNEWIGFSNPRNLLPLFFSVGPSEALSPVLLSTRSEIAEAPHLNGSSEEDFVFRYFGEGIRPIVWFGDDDAQDKLLRLLRGLWPKLRQNFSACSFSLQPRSIGQRIFDVMFAPSEAIARFSKLSSEHFVDSAPSPVELWQKELSEFLFSEAQTFSKDELSLMCALGNSPLEIRKVFVFRELWRRSHQKMTAAIGAIDLLESLEVSEATETLHRLAIERASDSFRKLSTQERKEVFFMLLLRLTRDHSSAEWKDQSFARFLSALVPEMLKDSPGETIEGLERNWLNARNYKSVTKHIVSEIARLLPDNVVLADAVAESSQICADLLSEQPVALAQAINSFSSSNLEARFLDLLTRSQKELSESRLLLLGTLDLRHHPLSLRRLLTDITQQDVRKILDVLSLDSSAVFDDSETREIVIERLVKPYPLVVSDWVSGIQRHSEGLAEISAATFSSMPSTYKEICGLSPKVWRHMVFSQWLKRNQHNFGFVSQVGELASRESELLDLLLDSTLNDKTRRLSLDVLEQMDGVPLGSKDVVWKIYDISIPGGRLERLTTKALIAYAIRNDIPITDVNRLFQKKSFEDLLQENAYGKLSIVIREAVVDVDSCARAWRLLSEFPDSVYLTAIRSIVRSIDSLTAVTHRFWSGAIIDYWLTILVRAQRLGSEREVEFSLCGQVMTFAFEHANLPVSKLVVRCFSPLYYVVTEVKRVPETASSMFSFWGWDKGKELRDLLVDNFLASKWPPSDMARAIKDSGLIRKIVKRLMRRPNGPAYARQMYSQLASEGDAESRRLTKIIGELVKNPDYYEEWD